MKKCEAPWPHVEIPEFLSVSDAQRIASCWPTTDWRYLKHSDSVLPDGTSRRQYQSLQLFPDILDVLLSWETQRKFMEWAAVEGDLYPQVLLVEDSPGYFIRRHTDCAGKVISAQVYFPDHDAPETQGVILCDRLGGKAKQIPYRFNYGYAFKVTNNSWHKVAKSETRRRSLQIIYYDTPTPKI